MAVSHRWIPRPAFQRLCAFASIVALPVVLVAAHGAEIIERESAGAERLAPGSTIFPARIGKSLYRSSSACATAKLDLWARDGAYTVAMFVVGGGPSDRMVQSGDDNEATIMIGSEGCRIRVRIDRGD